jgi:hypothetical protein
MKNLFFSFLLSLSCLCTWSQSGTMFWFAPPDVTDLHNSPGGEPLYLFIQSQSNNIATVTVEQPANPSFIPIVVNVNPGKTRRVNLTAFKAQLETRPTNTINNTGLQISSTEPISVQYEVANTNNTDIASLKGNNGLGNYFYIPLHRHSLFFTEASFASPHQAFSSFDIVATQNNTMVRIFSAFPVDGHAPWQQYSLTLNTGQTYSCGWTGSNWGQPTTHPSGAVVLSDKPVAITLKGDSEHNPSGSCYDLQFEQLVPVVNLGTDHIAIKGSLNNTGDESLFIMAAVNGTDIYIDGSSTPVTTLFAGEMYRIDMDYLSTGPNNSVYVHATQPVHALHYTGFGCELGDAQVPPLTYGTTAVNISRSDAQTFYMILTARTANINDFTITGPGTATINPASFIQVPGTGGQYSAARIQYNTTQFPVDSTFLIQNSSGAFQVAIVNGGASTGAKYAYFSPAGASGALPLRLLRLSGHTQADGNYLEWLAGEDGELYRYELQMQRGTDWVAIETKQSGTTASNRTYNYTDPFRAGGARVYRIMATEISVNKIIYSNTITLDRGSDGRGTMNVYPNPSRDQITIQLSGADGSVTAQIYIISGQMIQQASGAGNSFTMDIKDLPAGIYMLKVSDARNQWQQRITKL